VEGAAVRPIIALRGVSKTYRRDTIAVPVLAELDLDVAPGEFLALMGPSGSGKSTILNLVSGIDAPTAGRVLVAGHDLGALDAAALARFRARHIGFIFQSYNLIPVLTAYQNVELPLLLTELGRRARREHVLAALAVVGLRERDDHYPRQLSGGQEQRVAIARAIVTEPKVLLADEPTGNLDSARSREVMELLTTFNRQRGLTVIMVTHEPDMAAYAGRQLHFIDGLISSTTLTGRAA